MADLALKGQRQQAEREQKQKLKAEAEKAAWEKFKRDPLNKSNFRTEALSDPMRSTADDLDDIRSARLAALKASSVERRQNVQRGHGDVETIAQDAFLKTVCDAKAAVVHFFHDEFDKCKVVDLRMGELASKYLETKFARIDAQRAPFFVEKLQIRVLPTVVFFVNGSSVDQLVGFDGLRTTDKGRMVSLKQMETRFGLSGAIKMPKEFYLEAGSVDLLNMSEDESSDDENDVDDSRRNASRKKTLNRVSRAAEDDW